MAVTQIRGSTQILDATISTAKLEDDAIDATKLDNTDDYTVNSIQVASGTTSTPSYSFTSNPDTGMWLNDPNYLSFTHNSVTALEVGSEVVVRGTDLYIDKDGAANDVSLYIGTGDEGLFSPANGEIGFSSSNVETVRLDAAGTKTIEGTEAAPAYSFLGHTSDGLFWDNGFSNAPTISVGGARVVSFEAGSSVGLEVWTGGVYTDKEGLPNSPNFIMGTSGEVGIYGTTAGDNTLGFCVDGTNDVGHFTGTGLKLIDGTVTDPSYAFTTNPGHGFWYKDSNTIGVSVNGIEQVNFSNAGIELPSGKYVFADGTGPNGASYTLGDSSTGLFGDPSAGSYIGLQVLSAEIARITATKIQMAASKTIDMAGNKITSLAAATANGDATRFEQTVLTNGTHAITGDQSFSSTAKITNLVDPLNAQDGATKAYVDAAIAGLSWKEAAQVASTGDVTIATPGATLDGYTLVLGDRILLKDQTAPEENGVYVFDTAITPLVRSTDADSWAEIVGMVIYIEEGTLNSGSKWVNTNIPGGTLNTTPITFTTFAAASAIDGVGTAGYNSYWTAAHTLAAEQYVAAVRGGLATDATSFTGVVKAVTGTFSASSIVNADVDAAAAIAYSKLNLSNSIVNADVNTSAAIAESKLALDFSTSSLNTAIGTKVSKAGDTMTGTLNIQHLIPTANGTYDLGQATPNRMRDIYLNGQVKGGGSRPNAGSAGTVAFAAQGTDDTGLYFTGSTLHYSKASVDQGEIATLTTSLSPALTSAHIFVGNGSNLATDVAVSGDATITNTGVLSIANGFSNHIVTREVPSGLINSSNVTFTLAFTPAPVGSEHVYLNGILQNVGAGNDYTISGVTITFLTAPTTGDVLLVSYIK